jgi:hypothetical protein
VTLGWEIASNLAAPVIDPLRRVARKASSWRKFIVTL